jgi:hypothetical protein
MGDKERDKGDNDSDEDPSSSNYDDPNLEDQPAGLAEISFSIDTEILNTSQTLTVHGRLTMRYLSLHIAFQYLINSR